MLIKQGDGKILDIIKESDERINDDKTKKALQEAKNLLEDGNNIENEEQKND